MKRSNIIQLLNEDRQVIKAILNNLNDNIDHESIEINKLSKNINSIVDIIKKRK